ncbi:hypothetical protein BC332_27702 [Capsicum chinense]|nr:hypothetical protein BC332_27702 [Capsicum chinense]
MDEHTAKTPTNSGIRNMNVEFDYAQSFSFGLTQEDLVKVIVNPIQLKKSGRSKEIRSKFRNDPYPAVLAQIKKLVEIITLCLQACDFYNKKGIDLQNHSRYKDKDYLDLFDVIFEENLPQQPSERLDCGLFMVTYAECLSYGYKVIAIEFDPNALRTRYAALL